MSIPRDLYVADRRDGRLGQDQRRLQRRAPPADPHGPAGARRSRSTTTSRSTSSASPRWSTRSAGSRSTSPTPRSTATPASTCRQAGPVELDGPQALAYVRSRHYVEVDRRQEAPGPHRRPRPRHPPAAVPQGRARRSSATSRNPLTLARAASSASGGLRIDDALGLHRRRPARAGACASLDPEPVVLPVDDRPQQRRLGALPRAARRRRGPRPVPLTARLAAGRPAPRLPSPTPTAGRQARAPSSRTAAARHLGDERHRAGQPHPHPLRQAVHLDHRHRPHVARAAVGARSGAGPPPPAARPPAPAPSPGALGGDEHAAPVELEPACRPRWPAGGSSPPARPPTGAGAGHEIGQRARSAVIAPAFEHHHPVGEHGRVHEVVGHERRTARRWLRRWSRRSRRTWPRTSASRAASGSSSSSARGPAARARARATRCASPPGQLARAERGARSARPEPLEPASATAPAAAPTAHPAARSPKATLSSASRCGEEQQVLEHHADRSGPRWPRSAPAAGSSSTRPSRRTEPAVEREQAAEHPQQASSCPAPFGPSTASVSPVGDGERDVAARDAPTTAWPSTGRAPASCAPTTGRGGRPARPRDTASRTRLSTMAPPHVLLERVRDGQRHRLGAALEAPGEGDRGPELAERPRPGQRRARPRAPRGSTAGSPAGARCPGGRRACGRRPRSRRSTARSAASTVTTKNGRLTNVAASTAAVVV